MRWYPQVLGLLGGVSPCYLQVMANVTKEDLRQTGLWIGVLNTPFVGAVCSSRVTATSTVTSGKMALKGTSTGDDPLQNSRLRLRHPEPRTL